MSRKCDGVTLPEYYTGPIRRPANHCTGCISGNEYLWDLIETWQTTAEWLEWIRRHDGRKLYYGRIGLHYPVRPIIGAHRIPWFTQKVRRLPE